MMFSRVIVCINRKISEYFHRAKPNGVVQITVEPLNNSHTAEVLMSDDWPVQRWPMLGRYHPFPPFHSQGLKSLFCNVLDYSIQFFCNFSSENLVSNQPIFPSPCYLPACTWVEKNEEKFIFWSLLGVKGLSRVTSMELSSFVMKQL